MIQAKHSKAGAGLIIYFSKSSSSVNTSYELKKTVRNAIQATLKYEKIICDTEVSVTFCDNEYIHKINLEYRKIDKPTDVLSFPLVEDINDEGLDLPQLPLGDIVLSLEKAGEQAEEYGYSFLHEVAFLCIHSTLHLLGYDHEKSKEDDEDMCRRQKEIIAEMGI